MIVFLSTRTSWTYTETENMHEGEIRRWHDLHLALYNREHAE